MSRYLPIGVARRPSPPPRGHRCPADGRTRSYATTHSTTHNITSRTTCNATTSSSCTNNNDSNTSRGDVGLRSTGLVSHHTHEPHDGPPAHACVGLPRLMSSSPSSLPLKIPFSSSLEGVNEHKAYRTQFFSPSFILTRKHDLRFIQMICV